MAKDRIDRNTLADKLIETASAAEDPLRAMAEILTDFLMEAEVTAKIGAAPHERSEDRSTHRNGHRERRWDTRLGTITLNVPKVREGGYVPSFIEHRKRSEQGEHANLWGGHADTGIWDASARGRKPWCQWRNASSKVPLRT